MKKILAGIMIVVALGGCTNNDSMRVLQENGYTHIELGGHSFFGCPEEDSFSNKFTAVNSHGYHVSGEVCGTMLGGSHIRLN